MMEQNYQKCEQERLEKRDQVALTMDRFFRDKQGEDRSPLSQKDGDLFHQVSRNTAATAAATAAAAAATEATATKTTTRTTTTPPRKRFPSRAAIYAEALKQGNEVTRLTQVLPSIRTTPPPPPPKPDSILVNVIDADGRLIGPIERVEPWNQWVDAIQNLPIRRPVKIRRGRKFTPDHLATIYDRSDPKGVKWIACLIQAMGEIQRRRCHSCDKNQGAFDDCTILGGPLFQKCGNCEWNRQGCHMPLVCESDNSSGNPALASGTGESKPSVSLPRLYSSYQREPAQLLTPKEQKGPAAPGGPTNHVQESHLPPTLPTLQPLSNGFTPANMRSRQPWSPAPPEVRTPSVQSAEDSPPPLGEITKSNLILRHNGTVYTYPECVEGVPLVKIDQNHPYWDPRWPPLQSIIVPQLEMWRVKYEQACIRKARGESGPAKFQTGRQVNRGTRILEYLEEGEISPYQLLSKQYTHTGKGTITAYDTLFRMCETLFELTKYRMDISPVEWLRHRLHEIIVEQGAYFNYSKTMHDFYRDPKLAALRDANGFKSIGRPSGYKPSQNDGKGESSSGQKRKSMQSQADTPRATPPAPAANGHSPLSSHSSPLPSVGNGPRYAAEHSSFQAATSKRLKPDLSVYTSPNAIVFPDEVSDTDSWSGALLDKLDWRIYQVKTRLYTSNTTVTQYWHWKDDERMFEHQVIKETDPVVWGVHRSPIDFHVPLDDIVEVNWNMEALQLQLVMSQFSSTLAKQDGKPRGDIMASFKRKTTMRRFLSYCLQRRLKLVKITA
ncbi:hypothetical protein UVI_02003330 [Ustilaginoidea virens]|uniref:Uncharacterized protein n=1 Tax=Ustilaginoidea virens TaxID=1159556 RepID=A0A1B5L122_USTVR|nr:hypothetical protein UVI_02003330 [Ustilaginoidea virens]